MGRASPLRHMTLFESGLKARKRIRCVDVRAKGLMSQVPKIIKLGEVAAELGCSLPQLAIAWCIKVDAFDAAG
jgi:aryl-alcohol dehydrogenase-like predicted oxidoreductase